MIVVVMMMMGMKMMKMSMMLMVTEQKLVTAPTEFPGREAGEF